MKTLQRTLVMLLWCVMLFASKARADTITYFHNDLLGSPAAATNESGTVIWREAYSGYGERIKNEAASAPNKVWYTSRHQDADTGLVYMGARYYDPALGRFLSVDSVGFNEGNVHGFNRYAYANNNPYRFKDPDGKLAAEFFLTSAVLIAGGVYVANCESCVQSAGRALRTVGGAIRRLGNMLLSESAEGDGKTGSSGEEKIKPEDGKDSATGKGKDVPDRANPGEVREGKRRTREYDSEGKPLRDYDKPHQGYERPHVHEWENGGREHPGRDYSPVPREGS